MSKIQSHGARFPIEGGQSSIAPTKGALSGFYGGNLVKSAVWEGIGSGPAS
jgi:hypothetical protein